MASRRSSSANASASFELRTSSLASMNMTTRSLFWQHALRNWLRSWMKTCLGQSILSVWTNQPITFSGHTIQNGTLLVYLQKQFTEYFLNLVFTPFFPCISIQHHRPRPVLSCPFWIIRVVIASWASSIVPPCWNCHPSLFPPSCLL